MSRMHVPIGPAGMWWAQLGRDSDLGDVGVVLDATRLAEIRAHNATVELDAKRARRKARAAEVAAEARARNARRRS